MKATLEPVVKFMPLTLTVVIESETDLALMWAVFNSSEATIMENSKHNPTIKGLLQAFNDEHGITVHDNIWRILDQAAKARGLRSTS